MKKKTLLLLPILVSNYFIAIAQTGPGGIATRDGASSLVLWLKSDDLNANGNLEDNPSNGTTIDTWHDFSGHSNNFTQTTTINQPTYDTSGTFNAVNFDASQVDAKFMNNAITGTYASASVFFVTKPVNSGTANGLFDNAFAALRANQFPSTGVAGYTLYNVGDYTTNLSTPFGQNTIISFHKEALSNYLTVFVNHEDFDISVPVGAGIPYDRIGKNISGTDEASGDFYEVILFDNILNYTQKIILENYLSAKYDILIEYNIYDEDNAGAGNYDHDVAGIGKIISDTHDDSQGTGIIRISNPTNLDDYEFLFWGHDNAPLKFSQNPNAPSTFTSRLERVWRVSEETLLPFTPVVDVGSIDMEFDLTGVSGATATNLRLLIDTNNNGNFDDETPIGGAVDLGNNKYRFNAVNSISDNNRFTLGLRITSVITNKRITYRVKN